MNILVADLGRVMINVLAPSITLVIPILMVIRDPFYVVRKEHLRLISVRDRRTLGFCSLRSALCAIFYPLPVQRSPWYKLYSLKLTSSHWKVV